jgi:diguanylate cyclase (GGDEF)-like protein
MLTHVVGDGTARSDRGGPGSLTTTDVSATTEAQIGDLAPATMTRPSPVVRAPDPQEITIRATWRFLAASFFVLGLLTALRLAAGQPGTIDFVLGGLVLLTGLAAALHRRAIRNLEISRRLEAESFARILQGLSRSISPDAIVAAIVEELGGATGADHIVVVRLRPDARRLEATLVSRRPGIPSSTTELPITDLEDPLDHAELSLNSARRTPLAIPIAAGGADRRRQGREKQSGKADRRTGPSWRWDVLAKLDRTGFDAFPSAETSPRGPLLRSPSRPTTRIAERLAARVRTVYGLSHTLAAPLQTEMGTVGAIVLSRRLDDEWPRSANRILGGAAIEASAALDRAHSHRAAEARAATDALTGLPNRRYFDEFCGLMARRRRADDAVGVLMIDIDHFKRLNDSRGHGTGDQVLKAVAGAIATTIRDEDVPARYGGEEFAVLLRNPSPIVAFEVGERVRAAVESLDLSHLGAGAVSVSVGVGLATSAEQPIDQIVAQADRALYTAKRAGRNRVTAAS